MLQMEQLEKRELLAVVTSFAAGILTFTGDGDADTVVVQATGATSVTYDDGAGLGSFDETGVTGVVFDAGGGDDLLVLFSESAEFLFKPASGVTFTAGAGTNDQVRLATGTLTGATAVYNVTGPDSGDLTFTHGGGDLAFDFTGLELIEDSIPATNLTSNVTAGGERIDVIVGPTLAPISTFVQGPVYLDGGDWDESDHYPNGGDAVIDATLGFIHDESFNADSVDPLKDVLVIGTHSGFNQVISGEGPEIDGFSYVAASQSVAANGLTAQYANAEVPAHAHYTGSNIVLDFTDISGSGTATGLGAGGQLERIDMGFAFQLFGQEHQLATITSEGYLHFSDNSTLINNPPAVANFNRPNSTIGAWWENLDPSAVGAEVYYETVGTAPNRQFIVQYEDVPYQGTALLNTFQIVLSENTTNIEIHYQSISDDADGNPQQISVENQRGTELDIIYRAEGTGTLNGSGYLLQQNGAAIAASFDEPAAVGVSIIDLSTVDFTEYDVIYVGSDAQDMDDTSGPTAADLNMLATRKNDIRDFVRQGGGVMAFTEQRTTAIGGAFGWLELPDLFETVNLSSSNEPLKKGPDAPAALPVPVVNASIKYHQEFAGPVGFNGLVPFLLQDNLAERIIAIGQGAINESIGGATTADISDGGTGAFTTLRTGNKDQIEINALGGDDVITVGAAGDDLENLGIIVIDGGPDTDTDSLTINDDGDLTGDTVVIDSTSVVGLAGAAINYTAIDDLSVTATQGEDSFSMDLSAPGDLDTVHLAGSAGNDLFGTSDADRIAPSMQVAISIDGGSPVVGDAGVPPGDFLWLTMFGTQAPVVVDTVGGNAISQDHEDITFTSIEMIDLIDDSGNVIPSEATRDLYARGTDGTEPMATGNDRMIFSAAGGGRVLYRINNFFFPPLGPYPDADARIIAYGREGADIITVSGNLNMHAEVYAEDGPDYVATGTGDDTVYGGAGRDRLLGGEGSNTLFGGTENDILATRDGNDSLFGEDGSDELIGGSGNDYLDGGFGNDKISGGNGHDILVGGDGTDVLHGQAGNDILYGQVGNDLLLGDRGKDILIGGAGVDKLFGQGNGDIIIGGTVAQDPAVPADLATLGTILNNWAVVSTDVNDAAADLAFDALAAVGDDEADELSGGGSGDFFSWEDSPLDLGTPNASQDRVTNVA
jgi:Ca2+-binding RTX toxin-like protein